MLTFTIPLADRDPNRLRLSLAEASEMAALGFRFSAFEPEANRFRLSIPYRTLENLDRATLTFQQSLPAGHAAPPPPPPDDTLFEPSPARPRTKTPARG